MRKHFRLLLALLFLFAMPSWAGAATTAFGSVPAAITAVVSDGTYNFIGTNNGKVYKQTISGGAISGTLVAQLPASISSLSIGGTSLYIVTSAGKVYYVATATTGLATTGNAATATALAANGANCSAGEAPLGVSAAGASESCYSVLTPTGSGASLTAVPDNAALYPTLNQNTTGTAANLTAAATLPAGTRLPVQILDNVAGPTAVQSYNSLNVVNEAITVTLPTAVAGMSMCVKDIGSAHDVIIDIQGSDTVMLLGAEDTAGDGITNASGSSTGDFACLISHTAGKWIVMQSQGTWTQQ